jgi:LL-diaminopimelate aminotransferase
MAVLSERLRALPPYLFTRIEELKRETLKKGVDVIDLSIGDPDLATPLHIVESMKQAVENSAYHHYPSSEGMESFREAVSRWYKKRFDVMINSGSEVVSLIGSKEGIGHIPLAYVNPGDVVLVPTPGYPVYAIGTLFAGGESYFLPLKEENSFLPDLKSIPEDVLKKARLMWLNYPNNPTAALAPKEFFEEVISLAKQYDIIVCHDAAYSELYFDGNKPLSFLEMDGAMDVGVEIHSLSKTYNMTGWRIGWAVGNADILRGLAKIKSNLDSGVFEAVQAAAITAIDTDDKIINELRMTYQKRRDALYLGLKDAGIEAKKPDATFYLWAKVPEGFDSTDYATHLLEKAGVLATPGNGFGEPGEGYIRFALTVPTDRLREAVERIKEA